MKNRILIVAFIVILVLASLILWPQLDLTVSGWFYTPGQGFSFAAQPFFLFMEKLVYNGSRALGIFLALLVLVTALSHKPFWNIDAKGWLFLLLALLLGPGFIANVAFKDHWGRARPREVVEFAGTSSFSPALVPQEVIHKNGSFVSGDAAFGFYLPSFAYMVPRRLRQNSKQKTNLSRRFFWAGIGVGALFSLSRLMVGAHFFSDILFAAVFMLAVSAALHAVLYGSTQTAMCWRDWFFEEKKIGK